MALYAGAHERALISKKDGGVEVDGGCTAAAAPTDKMVACSDGAACGGGPAQRCHAAKACCTMRTLPGHTLPGLGAVQLKVVELSAAAAAPSDGCGGGAATCAACGPARCLKHCSLPAHELLHHGVMQGVDLPLL